MWDMHEKELWNRIKGSPSERYRFFIEAAASWEVVWSLRSDEGWVLQSDDQGGEIVPVWPHPRTAETCASGGWAGSKPHAITLADWLEKWIPGLRADNRRVAVFPAPDQPALVVEPEQLREDLEAALTIYNENQPVPNIDTNLYGRPVNGWKKRQQERDQGKV